MPTTTASCSARMYSRSGYSLRESRKPCSTVPGFPNMYLTPSARNCSIMAKRPVLAVTSPLAGVDAAAAHDQDPLGHLQPLSWCSLAASRRPLHVLAQLGILNPSPEQWIRAVEESDDSSQHS